MTALTDSAPLERIYRRNFIFFVADGILFMVAMGIIGPTTVIPDFVRRLTDSEILIGLSGSIFTIGFTLPQLLVARYIVRAANKKWWFIGPNIPVRFVILIFAGITVFLGKDRPELILVAFLICYSIAALGDGLVGVPWSDLAGSSLDSRWRARMYGSTSALTGLIMLGIAPLIGIVLGATGPGFPNNYALLFGVAGVLFVLSILPVIFVKELPGGKPVDKIPAMTEFIPDLGRLLRTDAPYRAMIIARLLVNLFLMASPFYVGFATVQLGLSSEVAVPTLLAMQTIGTVSGALLYTWLGARNNLLYIRLALLGAALLPVSALLAGVVGPLPLYFGFLLSGLATSNLLFGFQNWILTYAPADQRPIYIGLYNTLGAVFSMMAPFIGGTIAERLGYEELFVIALLMAFSALFITVRYIHNPRLTPQAAVGD
jgi:MFS family permease